MGMTMTQKILAAHAGLESVQAGQLINAKLDMVLGNDVTSPVAINEMNKFGKNSVFDKTRISLVMTTSLQTRIFSLRKTVSRFANLPLNSTLSIITMWAQWALSMRFFPSRAL